MKRILCLFFMLFLTIEFVHAREYITIVGSSTVYPYSQAVAEEFTREGNKSPVLESTGTGGGMKLFCKGIGQDHPDITGASRAMKRSEWKDCKKNGVDNVTQVIFGYDGLSLAISIDGLDYDLTKEDLFLALSSKVPFDTPDGLGLVENPFKTWKDLNPNLPEVPILVYGPPPTSGTRDAFVELVMHEGCKTLNIFKDAPKERIKKECSLMRQDGAFVEAGENDNLIVQRLVADKKAIGIFGYSFLYENQDKLKSVLINGVKPTTETISKGTYKISRPLLFYVKNEHLRFIPNLKQFVNMFLSEDAIGSDGYLVDRGLVSLENPIISSMKKIFP